MNKLRRESGITIHGDGEVGGKGEGLIRLGGAGIRRIAPLKTEVLSTEFYRRFMDNGKTFDEESLALLQTVHASFNGDPLSVRPSEKDEDDPMVATSGANTSFMLPNNHPDLARRFGQFLKAVTHAFTQHAQCDGGGNGGVAIVVNQINGVLDRMGVGDFFYPMSSGVADTFFYYPVAGKKPEEGVARVAFGHGYSTVRNDFDIVPVLTIRNPEKPSGISRGQTFFYAIDMGKNEVLEGRDMETMIQLHIRHASSDIIRHFGTDRRVDFDSLLADDRLGYASGLRQIVEEIATKLGPSQIEFTFNVLDGEGVFHVVQCKRMPKLDSKALVIPDDGKEIMLSTDHVQGHGIIEGIRSTIVITPFNYRKADHAEVKGRLRQLNQEMKERGERYILVCPGRVGTTNLEWGINVGFSDISAAGVIVEYGYDISGRPDIVVTEQEMTGGICGSHFLYSILGNAAADERVRQLRMLGSQGTHFITNLITTGAIYLHVDPSTSIFDPWFFEPPEGRESSPIYAKTFEDPVTAYADLFNKRCLIK